MDWETLEMELEIISNYAMKHGLTFDEAKAEIEQNEMEEWK